MTAEEHTAAINAAWKRGRDDMLKIAVDGGLKLAGMCEPKWAVVADTA